MESKLNPLVRNSDFAAKRKATRLKITSDRGKLWLPQRSVSITVGVKVSGGVRSAEDAMLYLELTNQIFVDLSSKNQMTQES